MDTVHKCTPSCPLAASHYLAAFLVGCLDWVPVMGT